MEIITGGGSRPGGVASWENYEDSSEEAVNEYEEMQMHIGIILINIKTKREVG